jgi:hypothetical protein
MSYADIADFDSRPMLAHLGFKPVTIFNGIIALIALGLSSYTFYQNATAEARTQSQQRERMLFGAYTLGLNYEFLLLCANRNLYAHCTQSVKDDDFRKLDPIADVLLESQVDWPTLRGSGQLENPENSMDTLSPGNIVREALFLHYVDRKVGDAFIIGKNIKLLFTLADDPSVSHNPVKRAEYARVATAVNLFLAQYFDGMCHDVPIDPNSPDHDSIKNLNTCVADTWGP